MAITEQKVWVTSRGTKFDTLEAAKNFEIIEQLERIEDSFISWGNEELDVKNFALFLREDPSAKPFVEAINHLYNQNPVSKTDDA